MADSKITALAAISTVDPTADPLVIVDVSDTSMAASGTTKKITSNQILGAGGTATLASATITGDLTVDTSTLKVDSANNRVGIGTASPAATAEVNGGNLYINGNAGAYGLYSFYDRTNYANIFSLIRHNGDSGGTQIYNINSSTDRSFNFYSGTTLAGASLLMTLNSTGLGVGVTPSAWGSNSKALQVGGGSASVSSTGAGSTASRFAHGAYFDNTNWLYQYTGVGPALYQVTGANTGSTHAWYTSAGGTAGNTITDFATAKMVLDASGNLLVGTTSALIASSRRLSVVGTVAAALQSTGAATVETVNVWHTATTGNNIFIDFDTEASVTSRGSITYNRSGGLVAYNTTSDYRAKDIIGPVSNSGSVIDSLKVYIGKMKGASVERPMLVAHEAQTVAPYAVTGEKDAVDVDGNPRYQQMDVSSFVPLLIAEIQSLRTRVAALEA